MNIILEFAIKKKSNLYLTREVDEATATEFRKLKGRFYKKKGQWVFPLLDREFPLQNPNQNTPVSYTSPEPPNTPVHPNTPQPPYTPEHPNTPEPPNTPQPPYTPEHPNTPQHPHTPEHPNTPEPPYTPEPPNTPEPPYTPQPPYTPEPPHTPIPPTYFNTTASKTLQNVHLPYMYNPPPVYFELVKSYTRLVEKMI